MQVPRDYYPQCPEALIVSLARDGDREAFEELVKRRQSSIRNLMRRLCGNPSQADDLAQQAFLKLWTSIRTLKQVDAFGGWFRQIAISIWLQHLRKQDALRNADQYETTEHANNNDPARGVDLDAALASLTPIVRSCIVLSYQEGLTHEEISNAMKMPLGTVKSHITRGTARLRKHLAAYRANQPEKLPGKEEQE